MMRARCYASRMKTLVAVVILGALGFACSSSSPEAAPAPEAKVRGDFDPVPFGDARPVELYVPSTYTDDRPAPLLVLLHGYGASGRLQDAYLGLRAQAEARGYLYAAPDGTPDASGKRFWNAGACCDFGNVGTDDVGYLTGLVAAIGKRYRVDPKRVFLIGHSNGGFMSYRLACDAADTFAGIVSIAGTTWTDTSRCAPRSAVSILHVHGTADDTIRYEGGTFSGFAYASADATTKRWATLDGCGSTAETAPDLDVDASRPGAETGVTRYTGCRDGANVELWTVREGQHLPAFGPQFVPKALDFLDAHPKP